MIALVGNPNSGKTTVFNALTGLRQKVANYPGVTVERHEGAVSLADGADCLVLDLPGTYSLRASSPDEAIAVDVMLGRAPHTPPPDLIVCVVDASNLERNLYFVSQIIDQAPPARPGPEHGGCRPRTRRSSSTRTGWRRSWAFPSSRWSPQPASGSMNSGVRWRPRRPSARTPASGRSPSRSIASWKSSPACFSGAASSRRPPPSMRRSTC